MKLKLVFLSLLLSGCMQYTSPSHDTWDFYLNGASFMDMNETSKIAKRPVYLGHGGKLLNANIDKSVTLDYGDKTTNDNMASREYMAKLEYDLYDSLRTAGISVERAGTDVVVILVRDAIISPDVGDISTGGANVLETIARLLRKYNSTYLEIAGYTDSMRDSTAARRMSLDMAERVGVYLSQKNINPARMFIVAPASARPIAAPDGLGGLANRRVDIRLAPAR
ncbi:MAG: OmpA family protein [Alphaproteobacteria bacterium]|nr:OmpA family protein [Alphaproteobacteria bacterium]